MGEHRRDDGVPRWLPWLIAVLAVALAVVGLLLGRGQADTQTENAGLTTDNVILEEQRNATAAQATSLAAQVASACAAGGDAAAELRAVRLADGSVVDACQQAAQVQAEPIPGERGDPGPPPTAAQIRGAVAAYLSANPPQDGRAPTTAEIAAAVTTYLVANPPQPGRAPTASEIAAAVSTYFAANPVRDGQDGRPPTQDEIQEAVAAYLAENPPRGTPVTMFSFTDGEGVRQICARTPNSPDDSPTYDCAPEG